MGDTLRHRIQQTKFESSRQEAMLNLIVAANYVREVTERAIARSGITLPQYNVLRILRGAHPGGHPRSAILARMLDRAPDVTRLIDRLEEKRLVERDREGADRRQSITRITADGLKMLAELDPAIREAEAQLFRATTEEDTRELSRVCELIYGEE